MAVKQSLLVDLDRCFGCFTCEVACQQEHRLPAEEKWIRVHTIGPHSVGSELAMDFVPLATAECDFCAPRVADGGRPACVVACPARALIHVDARHALQALRSGKRLQACKLL
jgi:anaerobic dimethyl sulfoxide reductase subunit B (iron-sulfur subunit)